MKQIRGGKFPAWEMGKNCPKCGTPLSVIGTGRFVCTCSKCIKTYFCTAIDADYTMPEFELE